MSRCHRIFYSMRTWPAVPSLFLWLRTLLRLSPAAVLLFVPVEPVLASGAPPSVNAGADAVLAFPAKDLTLFGHATDPENDPLTVMWTLASGPAAVSFSAPSALTTTVTFTTTGMYIFQLAASDGTSNITDTVTMTINPASSQTAFYVDPTYAGSTQNGSASAPWKSLLDSDSNFTSKWNAINAALATKDVIIYFSARTAGSDTSEQFVPPKGARLFVNRGCRAGTSNCTSGADTTGAHRLTLDGMSLYNTNDATPNWVEYTGTKKFKITCANACGSMSIGWDDDNQRDYVTIRGFEVTGPGARIRWGGNYSYLEYLWVHDVTAVGATVQFNAAVSDYPQCQDFGKDHDITVRHNLIERGIGEGIYMAGTYTFTRYGGCPSYGNTHSDLLIEGNTIRDPGMNGEQGDGIDLKGGLQNVTVRNNVIQNAYVPGTSAGNGGDGIVAEGVFPPAQSNYLFEGNRISGGKGYGIIVGAPNGLIIRNNVLYNNGGGIYSAGDPTLPAYNVKVYNNTVYGAGVGIGETHGITLRNNLLFGIPGGTPSIGGYNSSGIDSDYNLMAPTGSEFAEGTHSIVQTSTSGIVLNAAGGDFYLISASPAIDKGTNLSSTGFATDFSKVTRPQGLAWDIGAYEFGTDRPAPASPQNFRIVDGN